MSTRKPPLQLNDKQYKAILAAVECALDDICQDGIDNLEPDGGEWLSEDMYKAGVTPDQLRSIAFGSKNSRAGEAYARLFASKPIQETLRNIFQDAIVGTKDRLEALIEEKGPSCTNDCPCKSCEQERMARRGGC